MSDSAYKIENKPIEKLPAAGRPFGSESHCKYPFRQMKVGQSFYIAPSQIQSLMSIRTQMYLEQRTHGTKFSLRRDGEGYRCGRVK